MKQWNRRHTFAFLFWSPFLFVPGDLRREQNDSFYKRFYWKYIFGRADSTEHIFIDMRLLYRYLVRQLWLGISCFSFFLFGTTYYRSGSEGISEGDCETRNIHLMTEFLTFQQDFRETIQITSSVSFCGEVSSCSSRFSRTSCHHLK